MGDSATPRDRIRARPVDVGTVTETVETTGNDRAGALLGHIGI
jgi:hypothetical protein